MKPVFYNAIIAAVVFISCNDNNSTAAGKAVIVKDTESTAAITPVKNGTQPAENFVNFHNAEVVEYCVPVPASYNEDHKAAGVKGVHMFFKKGAKENAITVMGLLRSDTVASLQEYFKNTYISVMEEGKAIEEKYLVPQQNCFYAKGYWNNMYYSARFLEVTWLRPDEVVVYKVEMPVNDTAFWYSQLSMLINCKATCK